MAKATSAEMTMLMLASVSATLAVFYWRDWQRAVVPSSEKSETRQRSDKEFDPKWREDGEEAEEGREY